MKFRLPTLTVVLLTLLALAGGLGTSEVAGADKAQGRSPVLEAVRRVHVHRVWCVAGMETEQKKGLSVYAHVEAAGLRWESLGVEVRLRTPEGKPVEVAEGARDEYADEKGRFLMSTGIPVFDDHFEWKELRASIPYERILESSTEGPGALIATVRVSAMGLSSVSEAEITLPPPPTADVKRAVRLLAVDLFAGATGREGKDGRGLAVEGYVGAVGLGEGKVVGRLSIRRPDGRASGGKEPKAKAKRLAQSTATVEASADQAQMLEHFVDYRSLKLAAGRRRVIFRYSAQSQGLFATLEEEHAIEVPAHQDTERAQAGSP